MTEKASATEFEPLLKGSMLVMKKSMLKGSKAYAGPSLPQIDRDDYLLRFLAAEISITTAAIAVPNTIGHGIIPDSASNMFKTSGRRGGFYRSRGRAHRPAG